MADLDAKVPLRVKVVGTEQGLTLHLSPDDKMEEVARQVRTANSWDEQQHMRFISAGQELFMDDSVRKALGSVLHCVASQGPSHKYPAPKTGQGQKVHHSPTVDWLEMVDPGTVLMWIFGSILALLWLLFVCYAHMFDRTSVVMLCMMTIAFLIPCVLSYVPALRLLQGPGFNSLSTRYSSSSIYHTRTAGISTYTAGTGWQQYSAGGSYVGAIPPRPAALVPPGRTSS